MTIREVAEMAGVSAAAISRYLNGGSLSAEKRERIRKVIEETGYRPNTMAQIMRTGRGGQIGVILPEICSQTASQLLAGICAEIAEENYMPLLGVTGGSREKELELVRSMQDGQVAGILLAGGSITPELADAAAKSGKPVVIAGQNLHGLPCVYYDENQAAREFAEMVLARGRKRAVWIRTAEKETGFVRDMPESVREAWKKAGRKNKDLMEKAADASAESCKALMEKILSKDPDLDAVLCGDDAAAAGAAAAVLESGRRIPEDISIAAIGDAAADVFLQRPLTRALLNHRQCGESAAGMLIRMIGDPGGEEPVRQIMLEYTLEDRGTV